MAAVIGIRNPVKNPRSRILHLRDADINAGAALKFSRSGSCTFAETVLGAIRAARGHTTLIRRLSHHRREKVF
jgi:hypothetical protein